MERNTHDKVVITKAWRILSFDPSERLVKAIPTPTKRVRLAQMAKISQSEWPSTKSTIAGMHIITAKAANKVPLTKTMGLKSMARITANAVP